MGLLESMMARIAALETRAGITPVTVELPVTAVTENAGEEVDTPVAGDTDAFGVVWNEEFHASTRGQNNDGSWKLKRGVDKAAAAAYAAKFTATTATTTPAAPVTPAAPSVPSAPATPGVPPVPGVPATPVAPVTPASPPVANPDHIEAVKYLKELTDGFKVPYGNVMAALLSKHGVGQFDALGADKYPVVKMEAKAWVEMLTLIEQSVETLDAINTATGGQHKIDAATAQVLTTNGGSPVLGNIEYTKVTATATAICDFAKQWKDWADASGIVLV